MSIFLGFNLIFWILNFIFGIIFIVGLVEFSICFMILFWLIIKSGLCFLFI